MAAGWETGGNRVGLGKQGGNHPPAAVTTCALRVWRPFGKKPIARYLRDGFFL